jgi:hypothetical protein
MRETFVALALTVVAVPALLRSSPGKAMKVGT